MSFVTASSDRQEPGRAPARRLGLLSHGAGFWVVAAAFLTAMAFSTIPTPLYPLYEARDGFGATMITVVFAAYAVGVMASLYLAGHVSDWAGRRRIVLIALLIEAVSAVMFLVWNDLAGLLSARFISGVGIGILTSTATAHVSELRAIARPAEDGSLASTVSTVVNTGGLALGPIIGGLLAQFIAAPLIVPYAVMLVLLLGAALAVVFVPETVLRPENRPAYRPQRVSLPKDARVRFVAAAIGAAAGFAVFGVFTSLTATFVAGTLHVSSHLVAGSIVFGVMGASAVAQVAFARVADRRQLQLGILLMIVGLLGVAVSSVLLSLPLFVVSGVLAGGGVGLVFRSAIVVAGQLAPPRRRGEVLAGMFLCAYAGLTVPVVAVGFALEFYAAQSVLVVFALVALAAVLASSAAMLRRRASAASAPPAN